MQPIRNFEIMFFNIATLTLELDFQTRPGYCHDQDHRAETEGVPTPKNPWEDSTDVTVFAPFLSIGETGQMGIGWAWLRTLKHHKNCLKSALKLTHKFCLFSGTSSEKGEMNF